MYEQHLKNFTRLLVLYALGATLARNNQLKDEYVLRALLNDLFLKHEIIEMKNKYKLKFGNGQPKAQARADANTLRL